MSWKTFVTVFGTIFLAEMGDKTQLATLLFAAKEGVSKITVFAAASLALATAAAIGVSLGFLVSRAFPFQYVKLAAGLGFIAVGVFTIVK